ncbi:MAG TPA: hypothetical protein DD856_00130, partial [Sulfobacillus sp.]|nr:hypothetical protein [Sulfobacillus sp.]
MSAQQLLSIALTLKSAQAAKSWVTAEDYPGLHQLLQKMPGLASVGQAVFRVIDEEGKIRDS